LGVYKCLRNLIFFSILLAGSKTIKAQYPHVDHWETAIYASEVWKYHVGNTPPDSGWNGRYYADTAWASGKGGLGYGDGDDSTLIPHTTSLYLRKVFTVQDSAKLVAAVLLADYDDAFVAYFNGLEVTREGIGKGWKEPKYTDTADYPREARLYQDGKYDPFIIHPKAVRNFLRNGDNVLAIQIHNYRRPDDDMSAWFNLLFGLKDSTRQFDVAPGWFEKPPLHAQTTTLPIIRLEADTSLNGEYKIQGEMKVTYHGLGKTHRFDEPPNHYIGRIAIKQRGNSTLEFPKKSYRIETQTPWGENLNVPLLGFQPENDWVLYGPYTDKSLVRNELAYKVAYKTDAYGVVTKPCEVFINDYYVGVYYLMEKIKRDDYRVDIKKMTPADTNYPAYTGGYILKRDWLIGLDTTEYFEIPRVGVYKNYRQNNLIYVEPDAEAITSSQKKYIADFMLEFEEMMLTPDYTDPIKGYNKYIDISSFSDYMLSREFGKEIDSYRYSVFMYKHHLRDGNKLNMGPTWDFNIGFGNIDYSTTGLEKPEGWMYNAGSNRLFWFERLMEDPKFQNITRCRYNYFRSNILSDSSVNAIIDQTVLKLGPAAERNHYIWKTIGRYVWPNYFVGETYAEDIDYLKSWVRLRLEWMDANLQGVCLQPIGMTDIQNMDLNIDLYPNPAKGWVVIESNQYMTYIELQDLQGRLLQSHSINGENSKSIELNIQQLNSGTYLIKIIDSTGRYVIKKLIVS
jgi:hypothetical protein